MGNKKENFATIRKYIRGHETLESDWGAYLCQSHTGWLLLELVTGNWCVVGGG